MKSRTPLGKNGTKASWDEARSRALFRSAPAGLCLIAPDGRIADVNPAAAAAFCLPSETLNKQLLLQVVDGADRDTVKDILVQLTMAEARPVNCDIRLLPMGQASFWVAADFCRLPDDDHIVVQFRSIEGCMQQLTALRKTETRWKYALESARQGVWDHDFQANDLYYSDTWKRLRGLAADAEIDGSLDLWIEGVHPQDRAHVLECIRLQDEGEATYNTFQYRERHADGHWVWIESRGACIAWDENGRPTRIIGTDTDITERKKAEMHLEEISRRLQLALEVSRIGVFEANLDTGEVVVDQRLLNIYGLDDIDEQSARHLLTASLHPEDHDRALETISLGIASKSAFGNAFRIVRPDGAVRHIRSSSVTFVDAEGTHKLIGGNWDVTDDLELQADLVRANTLAEARNAELEAARQRIEYNALHDHLTGLPNRRYLDQKLEAMISRQSLYAAILHIDLDRFKQINDTLGHQAGDVMLVHTAHTLNRLVGENGFVARIGGDEFVVMCNGDVTQAEIIELADSIVNALRQPVPYEGHLCRFGASLGIAWTDEAGVDPKQTLMNADLALYRAKGMGRNRYEFFTKQLQTQVLHAKRTADEIVKGLEDHEFIPVYQPQFDARTLDLVGVETLARWRHPQHGIVAPDYFLKVAQDIDILAEIDRSIAEQALQDLAIWDLKAIRIPRISVNVSSRRLRDPALVEALSMMSIPRGRLSFELLESIFLDDLEESASEAIEQIKALGIDIEIDDFGTGHASIVGLLKLSPSRLKIDRALVMPITGSAEQRNLVRSIIDIGHSLNIEVIAEGVETLQHADILRDLGCDTLQGFALARPMPRAQLETFVTGQGWKTQAHA